MKLTIDGKEYDIIDIEIDNNFTGNKSNIFIKLQKDKNQIKLNDEEISTLEIRLNTTIYL